MWWGHSPALDLREEVCDSSEDLNVLLVGTSDARHILHTSARWYRHKGGKINWFVHEPSLESVARQLLLCSVALAPSHELGPREKVHNFMEIYGNTLLRPGTAAFLAQRAGQLARLVIEPNRLAACMPGLNVGKLRYKDRDYLQDVLTYWHNSDARLSMMQLWDARLRNSLGTRYDSRLGVFDWDYHMRLRDLGGGGERICTQEYKHWRESGMAFTWLEAEPSRPNPTLLSWIGREKGCLTHRGYLGDIVSGPFAAYGLQSEDPDMNRTANGNFVKRATDITQRNLLRLFHELNHGVTYVPDASGDDLDLGVVITELSDAREMAPEPELERKEEEEDTFNTLPLPRSQVEFLPCAAILDMSTKSRYHQLFNVIVVSHAMIHLITPSFMAAASSGGLLLVEGKKFVVSVRKQEVEQFGEKIQNIAKECGCVPAREFNPLKDAVAVFRLADNEVQEA